MSKHNIEVGLSFTANTGNAKKAINDLQTSMIKLQTSLNRKDSLSILSTADIQAAQVELAKLDMALKKAVNTDTGKFDLSKFRTQLAASNTDLAQMKARLVSTGSDGERAFLNLAKSIMAAEAPTKRLNNVLGKFATTMANTVRYQISTSMWNAVTNSIQGAFTYAQDLNKSLNDIRIVTGYNADYMARFAKQANEAAKALNTTTNEYAKASLIYFQQGRLIFSW